MNDDDVITLALEIAGQARLGEVWPDLCVTIDDAHAFFGRCDALATARRSEPGALGDPADIDVMEPTA